MFRGTGTALITPFKKGRVDFESLERLVEFQIRNGVDFLVVLGTTGEATTISSTEKRKIIRFFVERVARRIPIVVGTGSNCTQTTVELSQVALSLGADAVLIVTPYYNKPPQDGLYEHYRTVASRLGSGQIIIYNVPGRTGVNILPETVIRLAEIPNIVGIKEASGNQAQVDALIKNVKRTRQDFAVLSGNDDQAFHLVNAGGDGVISVLSNVAPKETSDMIRYTLQGKTEEARRLHLQLFPLMKGLFCETNPIPVKYAASKLGLCRNELRLPLIPASPKAMAEVDRAMEEGGILSCVTV
ncbi:MAG TPA: 4-hydroxy-tetrahydrodipicolinate synthase [Acetomicrobium sp.]|jgi:4-hydroxy-tetrahydrodipicolinate synthase|uniref:4-hydroxy-tetrahydrodipicolinate synthase n=1 Tax=Acetomicrobium mobile TaxID=97477 RepID=UPI0026EE5B58|nr:4-hydroxy-tetrahydrodipicolinate synthase [Acetomicrobium mobile]HPT64639.1 4-hydroxy-tetrahydrodipicolinate synthase [Acetomicrobium sp.]HQA36477.1 4-hydroxy-tetrahydrodipicolinate synthase [Acetomicrobium sp.]